MINHPLGFVAYDRTMESKGDFMFQIDQQSPNFELKQELQPATPKNKKY